jgi:hypothetical protein
MLAISSTMGVYHHFFCFFITLGIVGWCIQQDGTVRRKLANLLENRTDVHFVNSLLSEEGVEQVFIHLRSQLTFLAPLELWFLSLLKYSLKTCRKQNELFGSSTTLASLKKLTSVDV